MTVAASTASDPQHFQPAITVDPTGSQVSVVYYVQGASGKISVERTTGTVGAGGVSFGKPHQLASPFDLPPTNITVSSNVNEPTFNYHVGAAPCYGLGEYLSATQTSNSTVAAWGGDRQLWKEPPSAIIGGAATGSRGGTGRPGWTGLTEHQI
jgi:hypothetical protein